MLRIKKKSIWTRLIDQVLNSLNYHYKSCIVDSQENSKFDPGLKGLTDSFPAIDVYWL